MSEESIVFNNALEFMDFVNSDESLKELFAGNFEPVWRNMNSMRDSLSKQPCRCGGVNPELILQQRRENLESFYRNWLSKVESEKADEPSSYQTLKNTLEKHTIFKFNGDTILET